MKRLVFLLFVLIASCVHGQSVYNLPGDTVKAKNMVVRGVLQGSIPYSEITGKPTIPAQFNPIEGVNITITGVYPNMIFNAVGSSNLVTSVFGRIGDVVAASGDYSSFYYPLTGNPSGFLTAITSGQVIGALGYTPYNATNPSNFISGITSAMVTGALGYTPYNSTNPNSYISGINSSMVTTALGFTPYNVTNPSGYITLSSLANSAPITYNSGTGTIGISQATTSTNGYVSSTDWNTFNGKQAALGFTPYNSTNPSGYIALTAISATSPIFYNSATGVVSSQAATTSVNGYLTATDWNTFNGKQAAGSYALTTGTLGQFAATTSAQLAGVISDETGSGLVVFGTSPTFTTNITAPLVLGGTGTTSTLAFQTTSGVGATDANMSFNVGNNGATNAITILNSGFIGFGTNVPLAPVNIINASEQFRLGTDATHFTTFTATGAGLTIGPSNGSGTLQVNGNVVFNGSFATSTTAANANFQVTNSSNPVSQSASQYQFASSTTNFVRSAFYGSNVAALTTGANASNVIFGNATMSTFTSGTHPWFANVVVKAPGTITNNGATVTNTAALYIDGAGSGATNNYALYAASGVSAFGGNIIPIANNTFNLGSSSLLFANAYITNINTSYVNNFNNGLMTFEGISSGMVTLQTQAAAGTYNWNWPITVGSSGQFLTSKGGGSTAMTWSDPNTTLITGTPTIVAGTGAGTSPTVSVTTNGKQLQVTVTTGTLPTGTNATIATVTLPNALTYTPLPVFSSASAATALLSGASMIFMTSTGSANVTITSGTTALTAATTYVWNVTL